MWGQIVRALPPPVRADASLRRWKCVPWAFRWLRSLAGKALHMSSHTWTYEKLILAAALALTITPISGAQTQASLGKNTVEQATQRPLQVTYENGQLTIIAENSSLSDVMKALRAALGTDIDLPTNVADQRIWVHLGPGSPRGVLRELLDGTEFNYVIQASESDPAGIRSILLTQRGKPTTPGERPEIADPPANRRNPRGSPDAASAADSENAPPDSVASTEPSQVAPPASQANQASQAGQANQASASASLQNTPSNSDPGSPKPGAPMDQMVQQLQSMYQQRRQLQAQQNQKPTGQR